MLLYSQMRVMGMKKKICVYCSASSSLAPKYYDFAAKVGEAIAKNGYDMVYGGTICGMMGVVADNVLKNGGEVTGVIPERIEKEHIGHPNLAKVIVTKDMRERKATMEELSDVFLALPGGFGTLEEVSEMIVAKQLSLHTKPIVFLNFDGFYEDLNKAFEKYYSEGFAKDVMRDVYYMADSLDDAFSYLKSYKVKEYEYKW